jgi:isopenicillin-N epimerase
VVSHGRASPRRDRSRFRLEFDWTGTHDPTAALCLPAVLRFLDGLNPGGIAALRARNHASVVEARRLLCDGLAVRVPCPERMIGSMASVPLPGGGDASALQTLLFDRHRIEVLVSPWPGPPARLLRVSMHAYNEPGQVEPLIEALVAATV